MTYRLLLYIMTMFKISIYICIFFFKSAMQSETSAFGTYFLSILIQIRSPKPDLDLQDTNLKRIRIWNIVYNLFIISVPSVVTCM
jgi:hypothetical protein